MSFATTAPEHPPLPTAPTRHAPIRRGQNAIVAAALFGVLAAGVIASLAIGTKPIDWTTALEALTHPDLKLTDHLVVRELRLPRTMLGLLVGAALGGSGAVMQAVTQNPLADPGLLGVNAGSSFAVVIAIWLFDASSTNELLWFAFAGAGMTAALVYVLGTARATSSSPTKLALAGAATAALLFALTRAVTLLDQATLDRFRFWAVGSLTGRDGELSAQLAPFVMIGLLTALAVARQLNVLALGDDTARALGARLGWTRAASFVAITLLCGSAVAAAGPIGFVGLVVPHAARFLFGPDQRWLIPMSALMGGALLLYADTLGRVIARPSEVQVGIVTAAVGGPIFVALVRQRRMEAL